MSLKTRAAIVAAAIALTACSSGTDEEANASFCEATTKWGESLSVLGAQMTVLGSVSDGVTDLADPSAVATMRQIGSDLLAQAETALSFSAAAQANTKDEGVIEAIDKINGFTIDLAVAMGEDARDATDLMDFTSRILEDYELYQGASSFDVNSVMKVIADYAQPICHTS